MNSEKIKLKLPSRTQLAVLGLVLLVVLVTIVLALMIGRKSNAARRAGKPNIIIINADDLGYGDVGIYGQKLFKTPNLDRMAVQGKRFTNFYAGCSVCSPSRASLLSGKDTGHVSIRQNSDSTLSLNDKTIAEVLKPIGYTCAVVGKWGIGDRGTTGDPLRRGFDSFFGYYKNVEEPYPTSVWRNGELEPVPQGTYQQDLLIRAALDFITQKKDAPFFLYFAPIIVHAPYVVPNDSPFSNRPWPQDDKGYAAMIESYLDRDIGELFKLLSALGLDENTIVFFTSDNGPPGENLFNSAGPLGGVKRTLREGGLRVPLIVRWPGNTNRGEGEEIFGPTGMTSSEPLGNWDILPTIAELTGADIPPGINGKSFLPTLLEREQEPHDFLYWEFPKKKGKGFSQAVRMAEWKLIRITTPTQNGKRKSRLELFNLKSDIRETTNLVNDFPEVVQRIVGIMDQHHVDR